MHDIVDTFTSHLKSVLTRALVLSVEGGLDAVAPKHLLWSLATQKGCIAAEVLHKNRIRLVAVRRLVGEGAETAKEHTPATHTPPLSAETKRMIEKAVLIAHLYHHRYVGTEHLLAAILQIPNAELEAFFMQEQISVPGIREQLVQVFKSTNRFPEVEELLTNPTAPKEKTSPSGITENVEEEPEQAEPSKNKTAALDFFARPLSDPDIAAQLDPVIGREEEIQRVMEILCRRTKNNPLLLGDAGVGKTAVVEGLAKRIAEGRVPSALLHKRILSLDLASVVAGTIYRGEFEARMKQLIEEARAHPEVILFIDEIHTIIGAGSASGSLDAANMFKPALSRGELHCIGATTTQEYKKHLETDAALERRFQIVRVEEPSQEHTLRILRGLCGSYERHHRVHISDAAIEAAVRLSNRYVTDRRFPDKAIDVMDEAAAMLRVHRSTEEEHGEELRQIQLQLKEAQEQKRQAVVEESYAQAQEWREKEEMLCVRLKSLEGQKDEPAYHGTVGAEHVASVINRSTGIPAEELLESERERLKDLPAILEKHVVGQAHVTEAVARALLRAKSGIRPWKRPLASFLFVGPSGVGKTELARVLARTFLEDAQALIPFDMSEYAEGFAVSKLIGSPAGYVGYREGAKLTDALKQRPYAVVLFDELEKAHKDVQNLLLQILEEGALTDATGRRVSFEHAIIVATTNAGWERFRGSTMGFQETAATRQTAADLRPILEESFRPEFLNRLDAIHVFHPLQVEDLAKIAQLQLEELVVRVKERGMMLSVEETVPSLLGTMAAKGQAQGRGIRQLIQQHVEDPLAERVLHRQGPSSYIIRISRGALVVQKKK